MRWLELLAVLYIGLWTAAMISRGLHIPPRFDPPTWGLIPSGLVIGYSFYRDFLADGWKE